MKVAVIMISAGAELWDEYTRGALADLKRHEPGDDYSLVVVDNGGRGLGTVNIAPPMVHFAKAANLGAAAAPHDCEWLLFLNNDIRIRGPFLHLLGEHDLEGPTLKTVELNVIYVEGWALSIARDLWDQLEGFDELYYNSWDDVDLAWRAGVEWGVTPGLINGWPMEHLWGRTRGFVGPSANAHDNDNMLRFQAKRRAANA